MTTVEMLAREGHGAVQVDESLDRQPPIVFLAGPIKYWWQPGNWDSLLHQDYVRWRDAVRVALVKAGCAVYSPHRAIQGRWNENLQRINDAAIINANVIVVLTPPGVPAEGTDRDAYERTRDQKYVSKAERRGVLGWDIGKRVEVMPHYRRPYFGLRWTGEGRTVAKIVPIKGAIIHREAIVQGPTGEEGPVEP